MPKLPKKTTMKEVIHRVMSYAQKLFHAGKLSANDYTSTVTQLQKLLKAIDKK